MITSPSSHLAVIRDSVSVTCVGSWHNGEFCHKITKVDDGYQWNLDLKHRGVCDSFEEAWSMWPTKLTTPDVERWRRDDYEPDYTKPLPVRKIQKKGINNGK